MLVEHKMSTEDSCAKFFLHIFILIWQYNHVTESQKLKRLVFSWKLSLLHCSKKAIRPYHVESKGDKGLRRKKLLKNGGSSFVRGSFKVRYNKRVPIQFRREILF